MNSPRRGAPQITPNEALRKAREANGLTQVELAIAVGCSVAYIQAVERGARRANEDLARQMMARYGVRYESILEHLAEPLDLWNKPYTEESAQKYAACEREDISSAALTEYLEPLIAIFRYAAATGKLRVFAAFLSLDISEVASTIPGFADIMRSQRQHDLEFTFGQLRTNPDIGAVLGFEDDPKRKDTEIAWKGVTREEVKPGFGKPYPEPPKIARNDDDALGKLKRANVIVTEGRYLPKRKA
jgi:transcriptional regulator with XRE-family HTH domain